MEYITKQLELKHITLRNRLVFPPMASGKASNEGQVTDELLKYYDEKSQGGYLTLIIVEHSFISDIGRASKGQLSSSRDTDISGLKKLANSIHKNGTKAVLQINHAGGIANKKITGYDSIAPSKVNVVDKIHGDIEMNLEDIKQIVNEFQASAERAIKAGFDGVEIHAAHGYLLNQFYSPLTNKRKDEYGGKIENRIKIHLEIIKSIRSVMGEIPLLMLRLGACDYMEGGSKLEDAVYAAKKFEQAGIDLLDVSGGLLGYTVHGEEKGIGYFSDVTEQLKQHVTMPIIMTGGITDIHDADQLIKEKKADLIGVGRAVYKDSNWAKMAFSK